MSIQPKYDALLGKIREDDSSNTYLKAESDDKYVGGTLTYLSNNLLDPSGTQLLNISGSRTAPVVLPSTGGERTTGFIKAVANQVITAKGFTPYWGYYSACYDSNYNQLMGVYPSISIGTDGGLPYCTFTLPNNASIGYFIIQLYYANNVTADGQIAYDALTAQVVYGATIPAFDAYVAPVVKISSTQLPQIIDTSRLNEVTKTVNDVYVRSSYSTTEDLVQWWKINPVGNYEFSPNTSYIGLKTETNAEICVTGKKVHICDDETPPFQLNNYWFLGGAHSLASPTYTVTSHDKTSDDLGSIWETALGKQMKLIQIDSATKLDFASIITQDGGGAGLDTCSMNYETFELSTLTHVSGATHTASIVPTSGNCYNLLQPIEVMNKLELWADTYPITADGVYYCDELIVKDSHSIIDPFYKDWIAGTGTTNLITVVFNYRIIGLATTISHSVVYNRNSDLRYYGATQPMGLRVFGDYKPYCFIPKVKAQIAAPEYVALGYVDVDFKNITDISVADYKYIKRAYSMNSSDLVSATDLPDRIVYIHKTDLGVKGIGYAAGLSILNSATKSATRITNIGGVSDVVFNFANDVRNKMYFRVITEHGALATPIPPDTTFNYTTYRCYFNQLLNTVSSVHYYKEGSNWVVYIHNHTVYSGKITLPDFMEGLTATVIEKTDNATLLTDTVVDNELYVKTDDTDLSYIVLKLS